MRRLFSTFAAGLPGAGLALLRVTATVALASGSMATVRSDPTIASAAWAAVSFLLAILLLAGLWTPFAGLFIALLELARLARGDEPWVHLLLAAVGLALTLVGPGAWSIDAWLFGWRRIDLPNRHSPDTVGESSLTRKSSELPRSSLP